MTRIHRKAPIGKLEHGPAAAGKDARAELIRGGFRVTRQRLVVLDALRGLQGHPDASAIYRRARKKVPRLSLGTVYRVLGVLREAGLVQEIKVGTHGRFEEDREPHHHVVCTACGRIEDLAAEGFADVRRRAERITDFELSGERLVFYGRCPRCRPAK